MGLVFVLLLGEIDLSAGFTAGTAAAVMGVVADPARLALVGRRSSPACSPAPSSAPCIGLLVARLGIPSFVVTLAVFLGLQGVLLVIIGEGGTIADPRRDPPRDQEQEHAALARLGAVRRRHRRLRRASRCAGAASRRGAGPARRAASRSWAVKVVVARGAARRWPPAFLSQRAQPQPADHLDQGRARGRGAADRAAGRADLRARPHRVRPARLRRRRQRRGRPPRRHQRRADQAALLHHLLDAGGGRRHPASPAGTTRSRRPPVAPTTLLYAVGAAVIGGTSLFGGKGRLIDAVLGGLVVAVINNGMGLLNQPSGVVFIVTGLVLLVAASVDALSRRRAAHRPRLTGSATCRLTGPVGRPGRDRPMGRARHRCDRRAPTPGGGPPAQPRRAAAAAARARADVPGGADRGHRAEPEHGRRADHGAGRRRPGPRGGAGRPGRRRPAVDRGRAASPSAVYALAIDVGVEHLVGGPGRPRRRRARPPGDAGSRAASTRWRRCWTGVRALVEPRCSPARPQADLRRHRGRRVPGWSAVDDGWSGSPPTSAGSTCRSGGCWPTSCGSTLPVTVGNDADLGAIAEHVRGAAVGASDVDLPHRRGRRRRRA